MRGILALLVSLLIVLSAGYAFYHVGVSRTQNPSMTGHNGIKNPGNGPITAVEYQKMLGVGINVDWMTFARVRYYYFYWRSRGVNVPKYFKEEGFSNVRIRVGVDVTKNRTALKQLGEIVNDTLEAGLIPIITYTAPELRENPTSEAAQEHFVEWWKTVAEYFRGYPYVLSYDLLIESSGPVKSHPEVLNEIYSRTMQEIWKIDPYRLVFVTPPYTSSPFHLNDLNVTNDGYTLAEWHIYASGPKGCTYNGSYIEKAIASALNWSRKTGIPTWFGAWRPNYYPKNGKGNGPCPLEVELNFSRAMVSALSKAGIPYDINSDVHFFDIASLTWYQSQESVLKVILRPRRMER
ncbi:cellulase family glycosylhydrolase [Thermococcus sp.]|uniref:cellulase family glycosylhydrolase n=1 Tax=Thermococcus sp. TaxID=35749 RepID=UPI0026325691|nr:cellulase family glycosylhydrolase [Thermococcus sp.]